MATRKDKKADLIKLAPSREIVEALNQDSTVADIPGPRRWLILEYEPTTLFSLKSSQATSSVGATLVIPTPYSIKMALIDASFRAMFSDTECAALFRALAGIEICVSPAAAAVVTRTFVKIRQESRDPSPLQPYGSSIAYRELVHSRGVWRWAFNLASAQEFVSTRIVQLAPHITYIGKRGSFIRFLRVYRLRELGAEFTQRIGTASALNIPERSHIRYLDDFGPDADLPTLSSFSRTKAKLGKHRLFVETIIPIGISNSGPGFVEYKR
jgi:hypothetical protein